VNVDRRSAESRRQESAREQEQSAGYVATADPTHCRIMPPV
jgi:hypothetical protein